jgi:nicotinate-nucleotide adenylyltransferase
MKVGLFFGSFNPVHYGHLSIARFLKEHETFDQIWFVVSPNNPLKSKEELIHESHRLNMVQLAIRDYPYLQACDVEFSLPIPSYTIETLNHLEKKYPAYTFNLILGADNMENFHLWKSYEDILQRYKIYVYPRSNNNDVMMLKHSNIIFVNAPLLPVSATEIRTLLQQKKPVAEYLPPEVVRYIEENDLYN